MYDGNRGGRHPDLGNAFAILASILLCCVTVSVVSYAAARHFTNHDDRAVYYGVEAKRNQEIICAHRTGIERHECREDQRRASRDAFTAEQNLAAQRDMALWSLWTFIVSAITALLTLWALWYVRGTLAATRNALKDTSDATKAMVRQNELTEAAQRPWLGITINSIGSPEIKQGALYVRYSLTVRNHGVLPAHHVVSGIATEKATIDRRIDFGAFARDVQRTRRFQARVIAPKSEETFEVSSLRIDIPERKLAELSSDDSWSVPLIIGCTYYDGWSEATHYSLQTFTLLNSSGTTKIGPEKSFIGSIDPRKD